MTFLGGIWLKAKGSKRVRRTIWNLVAALALVASPLAAQGDTCSDPTPRFQRWGCTLEGVGSGYAGNGAYDARLRVDFTKGGLTYSTYAFWDGGSGTPADPALMRFRTAFPAIGLWTWRTTCEGVGTCQDLHDLAGQVWVLGVLPMENLLYRKGFLTPEEYDWAGPDGSTRRWSTLRIGDEISPSAAENFLWVGDSAWAAPMRASEAQWAAYLDDRRSKGFTVIHVGPATYWAFHPHPTPEPRPQPFLNPYSSQSPPPSPPNLFCNNAPEPTPCSLPNPAYWRIHERRIQMANERGLYVFLTGLMEPDGSGSRYPMANDARRFARWLAARLAGNHVIFSPAFDSSAPLALIDAVGPEIKAVAPRHLVTNHWNANVSPSQMAALQGRPWLDFQMAQSGFGGGGSDPVGVLAQRARELPQVMSGATGDATYTANRKAIVNGEGVYDHGRAVSQSQFNRFRARQSGYWSFLSGSIGYTFGAAGIWEWGLCGEPTESLRWSACDQYFGGRSEVNYRSYSQAMSQASSIDMQHFSYLHKTIWDHSAADYLDVFEHWRIANQPQNDQHRKMVVARSSDWFFAYLPENEEIHVNVWGLTGDPAARLWFDPREGVYRSEGNWSCSENFQCTFQNIRFQASDPQDRDAMLVAPAATMSETFGELASIELPGGQATGGSPAPPRVYAIAGRFSEQESWGVEVLILGAESVTQDTWFRVSDGLGALPEKASGAGTEAGYVIVWLNDTDEDGYREVWARRLDSTGKPAGPEFPVSASEGVDHRTAAVAVGDDGSSRIVWTSETNSGEPTTIWVQTIDPEGRLEGSPIEIGEPEGVARLNPKVAFGSDGGFLVAWLEPGEDGFSPRVMAQAFDSGGLEQSPVQVLAADEAPVIWLSGVRREATGYGVIWENRAFGAGQGWFQQALDAEGERVGSSVPRAAPTPGGDS